MMVLKYHETMCDLALSKYAHYELVSSPTQRPSGGVDSPLWTIRDTKVSYTTTVAIQGVSFGRLLVHGSGCEPMVFGSSKPDGQHHPMIKLIGEREAPYLEYIARKKVVPPMPPYYDCDTADTYITNNLEGGSYDKALVEDLRSAVLCGDWNRARTSLYEDFGLDGHSIGDFGQVLAPPNFYYAVFAVKRLWKLLNDTPS